MKKLLSILMAIIVVSGCNKDEEQPTACFEYLYKYTVVNGSGISYDSLIFSNCSTNATSYLWDFHDGSSSTDENPSHVFTNGLPAIVTLTAINKSGSDKLTDTIWDNIMVYKPNIYLYPEETTNICLNLIFPKGGKIIASYPEYIHEWCVIVEPSGLIDGKYEYLFYESIQPDIWQKTEGWVIEKENLKGFFEENMHAYGFNPNEITDFTNFWIPLLCTSNYYAIYPQTKNTINKVIELDFSILPQNINRLFYLVEGLDNNIAMDAPDIKTFNKEGFYINEWGVILNVNP